LYLLINPKGAKYWRLKYRYGGKEKTLALGVYPEVSLAEARDRRSKARAKLRDDIDPGVAKRLKRIHQYEEEVSSFRALATEWYETRITMANSITGGGHRTVSLLLWGLRERDRRFRISSPTLPPAKVLPGRIWVTGGGPRGFSLLVGIFWEEGCCCYIRLKPLLSLAFAEGIHTLWPEQRPATNPATSSKVIPSHVDLPIHCPSTAHGGRVNSLGD
jgi:hypothetical protein